MASSVWMTPTGHVSAVLSILPEVALKVLRTTNVIQRLNGEFRRRVKRQASLPTEDSALVLLFSLVASDQVKLRPIDGCQDTANMLSQHVRQIEKAVSFGVWMCDEEA